MTRIIEQDALNAPRCPQAGIGGGPVHPAHQAEVDAANRAYAVSSPIIERAVDVETMQAVEQVIAAVTAREGLRLYEVIASPVRPRSNYYVGHYFRCLVCGFVLPAQGMPRG